MGESPAPGSALTAARARVTMPEPTMVGASPGTGRELVGRDAELQQTAWFLDAVATGPVALVLEGDPGIGKTVLWTRAVSDARARGHRVLSSRPAEPEAKLSFASLGDLLGEIGADLFADLPDPQRRALEVALLEAEPHGSPPDWRAVGVALVAILRRAAAESPLVLALDDLQWIDRSSSRVIEFALRRVIDERVGLLLAVRTRDEGREPPLGLARALPEERIRGMRVGPLSATDLDRVIRARLDVALPPPALRQLHEVSGGNPFFAIEIAGAQVRGEPRPTGQSLPIPRNLRDDVLRHRLATLPTTTRDALLIVSAMSRPTVRLLVAATGRPAGGRPAGGDLAKAVDAGIVEQENDVIAFTHPLFGAAVYANASRERRHLVHHRIAEVVDDPEERARHLALAADAPDQDVATALEEAAGRANARGAQDAAAELHELSLRLTPNALLLDVRRRQIEAAACHLAAGDIQRGMAHLERVLAESGDGPNRAEALWLLGRATAAAGDVHRSAELLTKALEEDGVTPSLRGAIHADLALADWELGDAVGADTNARRALRSGGAWSQPDDPFAKVRVERSRALTLAATGDTTRAIVSLGRALQGIDRIPPSIELGRTLLVLGTLRRRAKQKRPAREALRQALDVFDAVGDRPWMERTGSELARIGGRRSAEGELTPTERRVASLAAAGRTNREIARDLFMSVRTVEGHLSHAYDKLGARSRTELALFFDAIDDPSHS